MRRPPVRAKRGTSVSGAGAARVVDQQVFELGGERGIGLRLLVLGGHLVDGGDQRLRDELAAERAEVALGVGDSDPRGRE